MSFCFNNKPNSTNSGDSMFNYACYGLQQILRTSFGIIRSTVPGIGLILLVGLHVAMWAEAPETIDLSGEWRFRLDPDNNGINEGWFQETLPETVHLPGSLNENGVGNEVSPDTQWTGTITSRMWHDEARFAPYRQPGNTKILFWLQPDKHYIGAAWYQKDIEIPESYAGERVLVRLERCHWETRLWIDGKEAGQRNSLVIPHEYDATQWLSPGPHTLTLRIDNTYALDVGVNAHSVSDNTQTNWNGVVGTMNIIDQSPVFMEEVQIYPNVGDKQIRVRVRLSNLSGKTCSGTLKAAASLTGEENLPVMELPVTANAGKTPLEFTYSMGEDPRLWNEFNPMVYTLNTALTVSDGATNYENSRNTTFGMRELGLDGTQFTLNGEHIYLRGTLECCIFPRTGYPPTDVASWLKILSAARGYGLNHLRFHSWCPPEAAFIAGDQMGFLFQIEGPFWTHPGDDAGLDNYIIEECDRILSAYGNHPSFGFMAYGNEPGGKKYERFLSALLVSWKNRDPRHLYTAASGWPILGESQYHVAHKPRVHSNYGDKPMRFASEPFSSTLDYRAFVEQFDVPVVSHEIGQWCVFPNLKEIDKYTGPLKPRNFEIVRDMLETQGMLDQAEDFLMASGKLQTLCYKEEIETALRTPGFGGFQLLDLHDFPGQGTALVGVLDPFWESKGYVTPESFRRFCGPTVPLMRMEKCVYTQGETFSGAAEVTHFGPEPLTAVTPVWRLKNATGDALLEGTLAQRDIPRGSAIALGEVQFSFSGLPAPAQMTLELAVGPFANDWHVWVYPEPSEIPIPDDIHIARTLDSEALEALDKGGMVLLLPAPGSIATPRFGKVLSAFPPVFWNTFWFPSQKLRTLGILCDPKQPLFKSFPTDFHSDWQWWDPVSHAEVMCLDGLPKALRPLVQVIDDWNTCRRLGLVFESRVGAGRLLACSMNIEDELERRPSTRQFRTSLLEYMQSPAFAPAVSLTVAELNTVFREPSPYVALGATATADSYAPGYEPGNVLDGDPGTIWHTPWGEESLPYPHWIRIDLNKSMPISGVALLQRQDMNSGHIGAYRVSVGDNPDELGTPVAEGTLTSDGTETEIRFEQPKSGKHILVKALCPAHKEHRWAALAEIRLLFN